MASVATAPITSVLPSPSRRFAVDMPTLPPAPGRFSTIVVPSLSFTASAKARAETSSGPPGG